MLKSEKIAGDQFDKGTAQYTTDSGIRNVRCGTCHWYVGKGRCVVVAGTINPGGICKFWEKGEVKVASLSKTARKLTSKGRAQISSSNFVFPKDRRYPIHDLSHARNALSRSAGKPEAGAVRSAVYSKYPALKDRKEKMASVLDFVKSAEEGKKRNWLEAFQQAMMAPSNAPQAVRDEYRARVKENKPPAPITGTTAPKPVTETTAPKLNPLPKVPTNSNVVAGAGITQPKPQR